MSKINNFKSCKLGEIVGAGNAELFLCIFYLHSTCSTWVCIRLSTRPRGRLVLTGISRDRGFNFLFHWAWHILILEYCFLDPEQGILLVVLCRVRGNDVSTDMCGARPARLCILQ